MHDESIIQSLMVKIECQRTRLDDEQPVAFATATIELSLDPSGGRRATMGLSFQQEFGSLPTPSISIPDAPRPDIVVAQVLEQLREQGWAPTPGASRFIG